MTVLANRYGTSLLNAEVPCPAILAGFPVQVFSLQPRIKLMEHDVGQEWRQGSLNAKDNFRFERTILGWRGRCLLDLRRKR